MFVGIYVAIIFFIIWTITVAKNARQEILEEDGQGEVQEMKQIKNTNIILYMIILRTKIKKY